MADRRLRILVALLATAFVVSVVHYADNYVNFADYPQPDSDSSLPAPGRTLIGLSWFAFTGLGMPGCGSTCAGGWCPRPSRSRRTRSRG